MREFEECSRCDHAAPLQDFEEHIPGNLPERQDRFRSQDFDLALQVAAAVRNFFGERLIVGRGASACRADIRVFQPQSIVAVQGSGLIREAGFVQRRVQEIARAISSKHAPRAVCSVRCWCKTQNEQLRVRISKSRYRLTPVRPLATRPPLLPRHLLAITDQPPTFPASYDFFVQDAKQIWVVRHRATASCEPGFGSLRRRARLRPASTNTFPLPSIPFRYGAAGRELLASPRSPRWPAPPPIFPTRGAEDTPGSRECSMVHRRRGPALQSFHGPVRPAPKGSLRRLDDTHAAAPPFDRSGFQGVRWASNRYPCAHSRRRERLTRRQSPVSLGSSAPGAPR